MARNPTLDKAIGEIAKVTLLPYYSGRLTKFMRSLQTAQTIQHANLLTRLQRSRDTAFGRDHGFARLQTVADYRRSVPIMSYEAFAPYIAKVMQGDTAALLPASDPILALACSSGSTGAPKVLPLTRSWIKDYRRGWELWGAKSITDHIDVIGGAWLQLSGPSRVLTSEGGMPIGMLSAATARFQSPILKSFYVTPLETGDIVNARDRNYTILRLAITSSVGFITTITPANLIRLAETGDDHREQLLRDVHDGTLWRDIALDPAFRRRIDKSIGRKHPARARELEAIIARTGTLYPKDYWPLKLLGCWLGGTVGYQASSLGRYYGGVAIRDLGLVSTEGRHTIPLADHTSDGVLDPHGAFYEFAVAGESGPHRETLEAHELIVGDTYSPILTTSNGLYRYDLGDVVRCKGHIGEAPILEFLHKSEQYSDMEGEKVSGYQMVQAVGEACRQLDMPLGQFTALPTRGQPGSAYYGILIEATDRVMTDARASQLLAAIDQRLAAMNLMYRQKRGDRSIAPPRLMLLARGSWARHVEIAGRQRGTGDTQFKQPALLRTGTWPEGAVLTQEFTIAAS